MAVALLVDRPVLASAIWPSTEEMAAVEDSAEEAAAAAVQVRMEQAAMVVQEVALRSEEREVRVGQVAALVVAMVETVGRNPARMVSQEWHQEVVEAVPNRSLTIPPTGPVEQEPQDGWSSPTVHCRTQAPPPALLRPAGL
jgi:uncharacterized membrane protein YqiK